MLDPPERPPVPHGPSCTVPRLEWNMPCDCDAYALLQQEVAIQQGTDPRVRAGAGRVRTELDYLLCKWMSLGWNESVTLLHSCEWWC